MDTQRRLRLVPEDGNDALRVRIETRSASVHVEAVDGAALAVRGGDVVWEADGSAVVKGSSKRLDVRVPPGADVIVGTASGSVDVRGPVGSVRISSKSGSIDVERAAAVDARTHSGSVRVKHCDDECRVVVTSGSVRIGRAGRASVSCVSGTVHADDVDAAEVKNVSGTTEIGARATGRVAVRSVSGTVRVSVPAGRAPATRLKSVSGRIRKDCDSGTDGEVDVKTVSGSIRVACA
jgi:DUF4097 and DUF4098 domain-containing protein YvlB